MENNYHSCSETDCNAKPFVPPPTPMLKKIGYGTGVSVYHLSRSPFNNKIQSPWALKKVNRQHASLTHFQDRIEKEAEILKDLKHPNIVGFRGISQTEDGRKVLAMEECTESLGDKIMFYAESGEERFSSQEIIKVTVGVAKALRYLHEEKGLLHGDLKSHNVLIKNQFDEVKLCDFGVSLELASASVDDYVGTGPWAAPETLMEGPITDKADIFSLGLIMWEMLTLKMPNVKESGDESTTSYSDGDEVVNDYEEHFGETPALPDALPPDYDLIKKVYEWCTQQKVEERPTAHDLLCFLANNNIDISSPS